MKKFITAIKITVGIALVLSSIFVGMKIQEYQTDTTKEYRESLSTAVAIINQDMGVDMGDEKIYYSSSVIETLGQQYTVVSAAAAERGYKNGVYGAVVTFPVDFSLSIYSINKINPQQAKIELVINPNLPEEKYVPLYNQLILMQQQVNNNIAYAYVQTLFEQFHSAQNEISQLFENDELDMQAVEQVSLATYTEMLNLGDIPQVDFEPTTPSYAEFLNQASTLKDDLNKIYVESYEQAGIDFEELQKIVTQSEIDIDKLSVEWIDEMKGWVTIADDHAKILSDYQTELETWSADFESYLSDINAYIAYADSHKLTVETFLSTEVSNLNSYQASLAAWQSSASTYQENAKTAAENISTNATDLSAKATEVSDNITTTNNAIRSLEDWHDYIKEYRRFINGEISVEPLEPTTAFPSDLSLTTISNDIATISTNLSQNTALLKTAVANFSTLPPTPYVSTATIPSFILPAPTFPTEVPKPTFETPEITPPDKSLKLLAAINIVVTEYLNFNPKDYLNDETREEAQNKLDGFSASIDGVEAMLKSVDTENETLLREIYFEYNTHVIDLRTNIYEVHEKEQDNLSRYIGDLTETLQFTSDLNHQIMDSFALRMPNSRIDSTVNQRVVEETIMPVGYTYSYVRAENSTAFFNLSEWITRGITALVVIVVAISLAFAVYMFRTRNREGD